MTLKQLWLIFSALIVSVLAGAPAIAQPFPTKPIRLIVPFVSGGSSDALGRGLAKQLGEQMAVSVIVENRPGAGGNIGAEVVAKGQGDGHLLLFGTIGTHGIGPALYKQLPFDPIKDFAPISLLHLLPNVLIVSNTLPVNSVRELIDFAKANPGRVSFASAGNGSVSHLAGELFKTETRTDMIHIPYKGGGAAMPDVISGRVSVMFETVTNALAAARGGRVRALAVTGITRWKQAPELPTIAEAGVPGYRVDSWTGLLAPASVPQPIADRLNAEVVKAAQNANYREQMSALGVEAVSSTPEEFRAFILEEVAKWRQAIQLSGAKID
jgi:tripartite-type tricarboxylate transporter receptor subunit TctC